MKIDDKVVIDGVGFRLVEIINGGATAKIRSGAGATYTVPAPLQNIAEIERMERIGREAFMYLIASHALPKALEGWGRQLGADETLGDYLEQLDVDEHGPLLHLFATEARAEFMQRCGYVGTTVKHVFWNWSTCYDLAGIEPPDFSDWVDFSHNLTGDEITAKIKSIEGQLSVGTEDRLAYFGRGRVTEEVEAVS